MTPATWLGDCITLMERTMETMKRRFGAASGERDIKSTTYVHILQILDPGKQLQAGTLFSHYGKKDRSAMLKLLTKKLNIITFLLIGSLFFFSCSKNITQNGFVKKSEIEKIENTQDSISTAIVTHGNIILIDTTADPFQKRTSPFIAKNANYQKIYRKLNQFYTANALQAKWLFDQSPSNLYYAWNEAIRNASRYGLRSDDYDLNQIEERINTLYNNKPVSLHEAANLDIHITEMYFLFTTHLMDGKIKGAGYKNNIWIRDNKTDNTADVSLLIEVYKPEQLMEGINLLQPSNEQYTRLQLALDHYRELQKNAPAVFPVIIVAGKIKPDEKNAAIPLIRKKLSLTDLKVYPMMIDSASGLRDSLQYDQTLADGIKVFQARHGLEPDGIIGERTLKFLNQSFKDKADVIALNMERIRWVSQVRKGNYIIVNVPEFKLRAFQDQKQQLEMRVIVGLSAKPTPIFNDELNHIVFSPTWTVPVSIIEEEIIPRLKQNPEYYAQKNYSFYKNESEINPVNETWDGENVNPRQYRIVQKPGPDNSLGRIKFMLANDMSVYLHDTPNHKLFSKDYRALSHGCIRLDEPVQFAAYLLRDQKGWTTERIRKTIEENNTAAIRLKQPYNVYVEYRTAWVDDGGQVHFREDIYGHDKVQLQQLYPSEKSTSTYAGI
jgi:L,D-transpeptidase YcbB